MSLSSRVEDVSIKDYLSRIGYSTKDESGNYSFYFSPFRNESKPSFIVRNSDNRWQDPGYTISNPSRRAYKWHSVVDLVMEVEKCDYRKAMDVLKGSTATRHIPNVNPISPSLEIVNVHDLKSWYLLKYLSRERKVDLDIARKYCVEAEVRFVDSKKDKEKTYRYIGFKTNKDSYELRNSRMKVSSMPKFYTSIEGSEKALNVFEGFMDYLSALTFYKADKFKNKTYVLNSTVNMMYLTDTMNNAPLVNMFIDNDETADKMLATLNCNYKDHRKSIYPNHSDFNEFICSL